MGSLANEDRRRYRRIMSTPSNERTKTESENVDFDIEIPENIPPVLVAIAALYGLLLLLGIGWVWVSGESLLESSGPSELLIETGGAIIVALLMICIIGVAWKYTGIFQHIESTFAERLTDLSGGGVVLLALLSSISEEILFRGALQPSIMSIAGTTGGLIITSLIFGLLHTGPNRRYFGWTAFAVLSGLVLGAAFIWTGNIIVPILIHFIINAINMWLIITRRKWHSYQADIVLGPR